MEPASNKNPAVIGLIAIVVIGLIVGSIVIFKPKKSADTNSASSSSSNSSSVSSATKFKDGTYNTTQSYVSPGGTEKFSISITVSNNKITDTSYTTVDASPESTLYQGDFKANYKSAVIGKELATLQLSRVAGSSLTTGGFNQALATIRSEAKA